jgi:hypothetical protein
MNATDQTHTYSILQNRLIDFQLLLHERFVKTNGWNIMKVAI